MLSLLSTLIVTRLAGHRLGVTIRADESRRAVVISKNQFGSSGLAVRATLAVRQDRFNRILGMREVEHLSYAQIAEVESISKERVQQILKGGLPTRPPGRPWNERKRKPAVE